MWERKKWSTWTLKPTSTVTGRYDLMLSPYPQTPGLLTPTLRPVLALEVRMSKNATMHYNVGAFWLRVADPDGDLTWPIRFHAHGSLEETFS